MNTFQPGSDRILVVLALFSLVIAQDFQSHSASRSLSSGHELELGYALFRQCFEAVNSDPSLASLLTNPADLLKKRRIQGFVRELAEG
jgi:hypothetical protein